METRIPVGLTVAEGRKFGVTVGGAFLVLAALSLWRGHVIAPRVLATIGGLLLVGGLLVPGQLGPVYRGWMGLAKVISRFTTPIFMGIVYFVVLTPMALLRRLFGGNPMRHAARENSYWAAHAAPTRAEGMEHQF